MSPLTAVSTSIQAASALFADGMDMCHVKETLLRIGSMTMIFSMSCPGVGGPGMARCAGPEGRTGGPSVGAVAPSRNFGRGGKWDWVGIVGTGQSLSVGAQGVPVVWKGKPTHNLMLSLGEALVPPFDPTGSTLSIVPLVEPMRRFAATYPSAYPANLDGETPHGAMAEQISALFRLASGGGDYVTVHSVVGESGQPMSVIDKSATEKVDGASSMGRAYAATLFEAAALARLARGAGKTYGIGAIIITHGESDAGNQHYEEALRGLWSDYNHDLSAITGQTTTIPMLVSQQQSLPNAGVPASTLAQWRVGLDRAGDIVCSGPKYQYPYALDAVHLTAPGYERLGEKYGEVYFRKVVLGEDWRPLQPLDAARSGNVITVRFHVPVPPLGWDDALAEPNRTTMSEWAAGRGFEVRAGGAALSITSVAIVGETVRIVCGRDLTGLDLEVAYALTALGAPASGGTTRWGQLRDSDPLVGATTGAPQPNYCVSFSMPVP